MKRRAKIVCTLGPATSSPGRVRELVAAGMDVARLNLSHGSREEHAAVYREVRAASDEAGRAVAILVDLQGPKIRLGRFEEGGVTLAAGAPFTITTEPDVEGTAEIAGTTYVALARDVTPGATVLIDDGRVRLRVDSTDGMRVRTTVLEGGRISDHKGINLPGVKVSAPCMSDKDRDDLRFALSLRVDLIALSFVRDASDAADVHAVMDEMNARLPVIAKIEKPEALDLLSPIVRAFDGLMVARGDLGVEMPPEDVPAIQKRILAAGRKAGKPVVVATQMLDSMVHSPAPTRAEASDVATAVYDGADAVMLSAETASGEYPIEAVAMMSRIIERVERDPAYRRILDAQHPDPQATGNDAISAAAAQVAHTLSVAAIVTYTTSGSTVLRVARERPEVPILALTSRLATARGLSLAWGAHCVHTSDIKRFSDMVDKACRVALQQEVAKVGDRLVITAGVPFGTPGSTNTLRVAWVEE
jgi:pyruvate kinase